MNRSPTTRYSLIVRLRDRTDQSAWREFSDIYRPVVIRLAKGKGLQHADAEDLAQQVLGSIAKAIDAWQPDPERAQFRTWLHQISRNAILNALTRQKPDRASGDSAERLILQQESAQENDSDLIRLESRREIFRWAAKSVRHEFHSVTWDSFWLTAVEGLVPEVVAERLRKQVGSIYAARSRVMKRLREKVAEFCEDEFTAVEMEST
jgi:RNA polymerase sigma factor (sigma-70 family)